MVPEGWDECPIDDLTAQTVTYGVVKPGDEKTGGVPFVRGGDFPDGKIKVGSLRTISEEVSDGYKRTILNGGEILVSLVGYPGATAIVPEELAGANIARQAALVRPNTRIVRDFLYHFLRSPIGQKRMLSQSLGSAQQVINLKDLKSVAVTLPPLAEQKKIAEILSTWDRAIEVAEAQLVCARAQKRALMQQLLTGRRRLPGFEGQEWKEVRLGDLVEVNPRTQAMADETEISFIKMEAVSEDGRLTSPVDQEFAKSKKGFTQFSEGDVLVAKITPCFENGKGCHAVGLTNGRGAGSTEFLVLRAKIAADQRFVFHIVNSIPFRGRGELNMQGSAGQRRVPPDFIRLYPAFAPQVQAARQKIADVLDTCDEEIVSYENQIKKLRTEKKALMQQLLTGKRRVSV